MKVGDLVKSDFFSSKVFLVMKVKQRQHVVRRRQAIWLYPDPDGNTGCDHTDDDNYYFGDMFEVVSESR